jgi:multiple sugar transport system ATP-binding protein
MNLVDAGEQRPLTLGAAEVVPAGGLSDAGGPVTIGFRPEALHVGEGPLRAQIRTVEDLGSEVFVHVAIEHRGDHVPLVSKMAPPFDGDPGDNVGLQIVGRTHFFDRDGTRIASMPATLR